MPPALQTKLDLPQSVDMAIRVLDDRRRVAMSQALSAARWLASAHRRYERDAGDVAALSEYGETMSAPQLRLSVHAAEVRALNGALRMLKPIADAAGIAWPDDVPLVVGEEKTE